jgi:hypothetical protein
MLGLALCVLIAFVAGCRDVPLETGDSASPGAVTDAVLAACDGAKAVSLVPGASVNSFVGPLDDEVLPSGSSGCEISISGSRSRLGKSAAPIDVLDAHFRQLGWNEEASYAAGSAAARSFAYRTSGAGCLVRSHESESQGRNAYKVRVVCTSSLPGRPRASKD